MTEPSLRPRATSLELTLLIRASNLKRSPGDKIDIPPWNLDEDAAATFKRQNEVLAENFSDSAGIVWDASALP